MTYQTPSTNILESEVVNQAASVFTGDSLVELLRYYKISAIFINYIVSKNIVTYNFDLEHFEDIGKIKKVIPILECAIHSKIALEKNYKYNLSIQIIRCVRETLYFKETILNNTFNQMNEFSSCIGIDTYNNPVCIDFTKQPHILIAGATGSGKSVALNSLICSLLFKVSPAVANFIFIDCKQVELSFYNKLPHTLSVITSPQEAIDMLEEVCKIMDARFYNMKCNNLKITNDKHLFVVIDELADLMLTSRYEVEPYLVRIAQLGRAAGIHLIIATQRPTVNVISGLIKANITTRLALQTASVRDSMNILDHKGAESLLGRGDGILKVPYQVEEMRLQVSYISDNNINKVVDYWCNYDKN